MNTGTLRRPLAAAALAACALAALAIGGASLAGTGDTTVSVKDFAFQAMDIVVPAGATVTWKNLDGEPHTVTSVDGLFRSGALDTGDSYSQRFAKPGVYRYLCSIHPRMVGSVTVK